jgi:hypothetical protein
VLGMGKVIRGACVRMLEIEKQILIVHR